LGFGLIALIYAEVFEYILGTFSAHFKLIDEFAELILKLKKHQSEKFFGNFEYFALTAIKKHNNLPKSKTFVYVQRHT